MSRRKMNNQNTEISRLKYKEGFFTAAVIVVLSFFCQWINWFAFEKLDYPWWAAVFITPAILCIMYHFVQLDAGQEGNFSRGFFFIFSVLVPLVLSAAVTIAVLMNVDASYFDLNETPASAGQVMATYTGRFTITSAYMLIFAAADAPVLRSQSRKRNSN